MGRQRAWRDVVRDALRGAPARSNEDVYRRVAKEIGTKSLTANQKAKVRQQLQIVGEKPPGAGPGEWKFAPKLPAPEVVTDVAARLGVEIEERAGTGRFEGGRKVYDFTIALSEDNNDPEIVESIAIDICADLEKLFKGEDTSSQVEFTVIDENGNIIGYQWVNMNFVGTPASAAFGIAESIEDILNSNEIRYRAFGEPVSLGITVLARI